MMVTLGLVDVEICSGVFWPLQAMESQTCQNLFQNQHELYLHSGQLKFSRTQILLANHVLASDP